MPEDAGTFLTGTTYVLPLPQEKEIQLRRQTPTHCAPEDCGN